MNYRASNLYLPTKNYIILNIENCFMQDNDVSSSIEILLSKFALSKNVLKLNNLNIFYEDCISKKVFISLNFNMFWKIAFSVVKRN